MCRLVRPGLVVILIRGGRQLDGERRPLPRTRPDRNPTAVLLHAVLGDGQAESRTAGLARTGRVDPARSRETGGSGLGLAITKHCVQENGGRISVWSRTGEGSTFTIELPAATDEDDDEARPDESTQA